MMLGDMSVKRKQVHSVNPGSTNVELGPPHVDPGSTNVELGSTNVDPSSTIVKIGSTMEKACI
jgi:hypothetical protein